MTATLLGLERYIYSDDLVGATAVISTLTAFEKKGKVDAFLY